MSKPPEIKYRIWDKKLKKIRTVQTISFDENYVICKDNPNEHISFSDIELLRAMGFAGEDRKTIYEGDIISFHEGHTIRIGVVVRTENGEWFLRIPKEGKEVPFPWDKKRSINVLGNHFDDDYHLSDEYARAVNIRKIENILSSDRICTDKYCRHDLENAIAGLSDLSKDELIEMVKAISDSLRYYTKAYFDECSKHRR